MSYPKDIDDYEDKDLLAELALRAMRRERGVCDYCRRFSNDPPCKFPARHRMAMILPALEDEE